MHAARSAKKADSTTVRDQDGPAIRHATQVLPCCNVSLLFNLDCGDVTPILFFCSLKQESQNYFPLFSTISGAVEPTILRSSACSLAGTLNLSSVAFRSPAAALNSS